MRKLKGMIMLNKNGMVAASCSGSKPNIFLQQLYFWTMVSLAIAALASNMGVI